MQGQYNQPGHGRHFQGPYYIASTRYLTRHIRVLFLAVIQPRYYYYYYYYYYSMLLIASYTLLEPGPILGPELPGEFFIW